ncbi:Cadherin-5 [Manis pentadactyla]|nr:Cadherin-5 [Manis pentadactyla]
MLPEYKSSSLVPYPTVEEGKNWVVPSPGCCGMEPARGGSELQTCRGALLPDVKLILRPSLYSLFQKSENHHQERHSHPSGVSAIYDLLDVHGEQEERRAVIPIF